MRHGVLSASLSRVLHLHLAIDAKPQVYSANHQEEEDRCDDGELDRGNTPDTILFTEDKSTQ